MRNKPEIKLNENGFWSLSNNQVVRPMGAIKNKLKANVMEMHVIKKSTNLFDLFFSSGIIMSADHCNVE